MIRLILVRLAVFVPSLFLASVVIFGLVQLIPGGAAESLGGPDATPEQIQAIRERLGTDRPLLEQYVSWIGGFVQADLGRSYMNGGPIADQLSHRVPVTFEIAGWALLIAVICGVGLGAISATLRDRLPDRAILTMSGLSLAVPEFWLGMLAIGLFAVRLGWVPASGLTPWDAGAVPHLRSIVLPVLLLSLGPTAIIARMARSSLLESLSSTYVRAAWAAGIPAAQIYLKFALKNTAVSVLTVVGLITGTLLGGTVLIETVFSIPGIGTMLLEAALSKDTPVMQATALFVVGVVLVVNLLVDISYAVLDPRTRKAGS